MSLCVLHFLPTGTAPTGGFPGIQNHTSSSGRPGIHGDGTTGVPGLYTTRSQGGLPSVASPGVTDQSGLRPTTPTHIGKPGLQTPKGEHHIVFVRLLAR